MHTYESSPEIIEDHLTLLRTSLSLEQTPGDDEREIEDDVGEYHQQACNVDYVGQTSTAVSLLSSTSGFDECNDVSYEYEDWTQIIWIHHVFVVVYVIIAISSVVGNFMVIWTIVRHRHMRTVTNYYILNLAVADFLVALVVMPLKLIEYTAPCQWRVFSHDLLLCPLLYYVLPVFVFASVLTLAAISIERSVNIMLIMWWLVVQPIALHRINVSLLI
jgi:7 transmembrane receptor (rhodopsin family)